MRKLQSDITTYLKMLFQNNSGSTTVFVLIILSTIIGLTVTMVSLGKDKAEQGVNQSLLSLSSRSILSEYNSYLKEEYGLFGLNMTPTEIKEKMLFYLKESDVDNINDLAVYTEQYRYTNLNVFEEEIVEYAKFAIIDNLLMGENEEISQRDDSRELKNSKVIELLPSKTVKDKNVSTGDVLGGMDNIDDLFDKTKKTVLANMYITNMFNNHAYDNGQTFFKNEVEYIIAGKYKDSKNYESVRNKIILVRNMINLAVIYKTPELNSQVIAMAAVTGLATEVAIPIIAEAWALIEANNDMKILEHQGKIPIVKNLDTWTTDIQSLVSNTEEGYIDNGSETGMDYKDYLHVLLYFTDKETKYLRVMDLMQINIQGAYDKGFNINVLTSGFGYDIKLNKSRYRYDETY